ncbi:hypothetical protein N8220_00415 [Schleiferiaceae bacterium]|nr:hypothetical protein [Schleiferiaceae bacterium]
MELSKISIVIPIKSDTNNLVELINNVKTYGFFDIHVVDSIEDEKNFTFCAKNNCSYTVFNWNGKFPKKRNWYLTTKELKEWVFFLDSDERINDKIVNEIMIIDDSNIDGIRFKYNNQFLGNVLRYGDVMTKIPLIRNHVRFEKVEEEYWSILDMEVHEHPQVHKLRLYKAKSRIDHLERTTIERYIVKHNQYSNWEAARIRRDSRQIKSFRQRLKYFLLIKSYGHYVYFVYAYIIRLGFMDGQNGLILARMKSHYFYTIYLKLLENEIERN